MLHTQQIHLKKKATWYIHKISINLLLSGAKSTNINDKLRQQGIKKAKKSIFFITWDVAYSLRGVNLLKNYLKTATLKMKNTGIYVQLFFTVTVHWWVVSLDIHFTRQRQRRKIMRNNQSTHILLLHNLKQSLKNHQILLDSKTALLYTYKEEVDCFPALYQSYKCHFNLALLWWVFLMANHSQVRFVSPIPLSFSHSTFLYPYIKQWKDQTYFHNAKKEGKKLHRIKTYI